jgi:phospholipase C
VYPRSHDKEDNDGVKPQPSPEAVIQYDSTTGDIHLTYTNIGKAPCTLKVTNAYAASETPHQYQVNPGETAEDRWPSPSTHNWFDLSITCPESPLFQRRFAGHVESGKPSTSDPCRFLEES